MVYWGRSHLLLMSLVNGRCVLPEPIGCRLTTVGSRAFPVAAAQIWNSLSEHIVSAPTLQPFRRNLKKRFNTAIFQPIAL